MMINPSCRDKGYFAGVEAKTWARRYYYRLLATLTPNSNSNNREREVAEMSRGIKVLALELDMPIILLSQLNRSVANKEAHLSYPKRIRTIEQDADNVMFLHKPDFADTMEHDLELRKL